MSSPGEVKVTKPVSPWSKDYHTSVVGMDTTEGWHKILPDWDSIGDPSTTGNTETRFVSRHGITERVMIHKKVYMDLDKDVDFLSWFHKETNPIRKEVHTPVYTTSKNFGVLDNLSNFWICRYQYHVIRQTYQ